MFEGIFSQGFLSGTFFPIVVVTCISLSVSFFCSLMESALLSVPLPYVRHLAESGSRRGKILLGFKEDLGDPIAAILIMNTIANTVGAAVGGAYASFHGDKALLVFSVVFTVLILVISEIFPKQLGNIYSRQVALIIALPLSLIIKILFPLVKIGRFFSSGISQDSDEPLVSHHEVLSMAELGHEEGVIDVLEDSVIRNVIGLDRVLVRDILTPRVVVFSLEESQKLKDIGSSLFSFPHTRIPIFSNEDSDRPTGYVTQRDIARELIEGDPERNLKSLSRPLKTVPDMMRADKLLLQMVESQHPICAVVDEHGGFAGVLTLEDILEEIIGREIVDEFDQVKDMRSYARKLHELRGRTDES
ncbi:MAG TPA: hemolysin family protein [Oligoflexia bacterium]|nr:hemolysin family protein [Oligoflexia bacterium]HMP49316.1 hemolysin family protein [Oligoflexia bacterium]